METVTVTQEEVTAAFKRDLIELLSRYNASLSAEDHFQGYAECGEDVRATISVPAIYDGDGNLLQEHTDIDLGTHFP
jgi:hypothetical protein